MNPIALFHSMLKEAKLLFLLLNSMPEKSKLFFLLLNSMPEKAKLLFLLLNSMPEKAKLLWFSLLYMVTKYCDIDQKKGTQHRLKCYKNLYLHGKRGRKRLVLANSWFAGNLSVRSILLMGLYFLFPFGWVEENRALFSVLLMLNKILTRLGV